MSAVPDSSRHFECPVCGEGFLSQIELNAHRQKFPGPHPKPKPAPRKPGHIPHVTGFHDHNTAGYRESGR